MSTPERAGWYDDPDDDSRLRYFDGIIWSDRTVPRQSRQTAPAAAPGGPGTDVFGRPSGPGEPTDTGVPQPPSAHGQGRPPYGPPPGAPVARHAEPTTADGQALAPFGTRVGAYIIDSLILGVINLVVAGWAFGLWMWDYMAFVFEAAQAGDQSRVEELTPDALLGMLDWPWFFVGLGLALLVQTAYQVGFLTTRGATPGKAVLGLSVRRYEQAGTITAGTAFMRVLLPLALQMLSWVPGLSLLVLVLNPADLLLPIIDPKRQTLHDKIAGTVVVVGPQPRGSDDRPA
ncbi:RDD family protein [Janibacter anophelis]|uniref:RDD family protein n=1 Tax=Janibacter anophelis TaxID=319054 RepID=UPI003F8042E2